ncbi:MAG TPA: alternative ribosome rescue aminoacyl-tRNA hydrolase ArfB [Anaerolineales bacterium]
MIRVNSFISLDERDLQLDFVRASGPGGQNVNKIASAVQLRFNTHTPALPEDVRQRLLRIAAGRITTEGELIIDARRYRTQEQNRQDALDRLVEVVRRAAQKPKPRRPTRPTAASRQKRLEQKRRRSDVKRMRREPNGRE